KPSGDVPAGRGCRLISGHQVSSRRRLVHGLRGGRSPQEVEVRQRGIPAAVTKDGLIELAGQGERQTPRQLRVQAGKVAPELIRERLNYGQLVRGDGLTRQRVSIDRLLSGLTSPRRGRLASNVVNSHARAGKGDLTSRGHDDRVLDSVAPDLGREFL